MSYRYNIGNDISSRRIHFGWCRRSSAGFFPFHSDQSYDEKVKVALYVSCKRLRTRKMNYFKNVSGVSLILRLSARIDTVANKASYPSMHQDDQLVDQVLDHYHSSLLASPRAIRFLKDRRINDSVAINTFKLGFGDRTLGLQLQKLGGSEEQAKRGNLQRIGLLKPSGHEFFHGALVFPFIDHHGRITGAYGRRITKKLQAGSVYHVHWISNETTFFNESALASERDLVLCKNPIDALSWWVAGHKAVVATMGMKSLCEAHIARLGEYKVKSVVIDYGESKAAIEAARKCSALLGSAGIRVATVTYPNPINEQGMDGNLYIHRVPDSMLAFKQVLHGARPVQSR